MKLIILPVLLALPYCNLQAQSGYPVTSDTGYHNLTSQKMIMNVDGTFVVLATIDLNFDPLHSFGFVVSKYNAAGSELWTKSFNTPAGSTASGMYATDMIKSADSGYIIAADSETQNLTVIDKYSFNVYKLDESGNVLWEKVDYNASSGAGYGYPSFIARANPADEYFAVNYDSINRYDAAGDLTGSVPNPGIYFSFGVNGQDSIIGSNYSGGPTGLLFLDSNANLGHNCALASGTNYADIQLTSDSCWLLTGISDTSATGGVIYLNKYSYHGRPLWQQSYACNDQAPSVVSATEYNGRYYITASQQDCMYIDAASGACVGPTSLMVICTDTAGNELSILTIPGNAASYDSVRSYIGLQSAVVADTLYTLGTAEWVDMTTLSIASMSAYSSSYMVWKNALSAFTPLAASSVSQKRDLTLFPDPTKDELHLISSYPKGSAVDITISSITGFEVYRQHVVATDEIVINTKRFAGGVYVLTIAHGGEYIRKKFVVQQ